MAPSIAIDLRSIIVVKSNLNEPSILGEPKLANRGRESWGEGWRRAWRFPVRSVLANYTIVTSTRRMQPIHLYVYFLIRRGIIKSNSSTGTRRNSRAMLSDQQWLPTPRTNDIGLNKIMNKLSVGHNKNIIVRRTSMIHVSLSYQSQWTGRKIALPLLSLCICATTFVSFRYGAASCEPGQTSRNNCRSRKPLARTIGRAKRGEGRKTNHLISIGNLTFEPLRSRGCGLGRFYLGSQVQFIPLVALIPAALCFSSLSLLRKHRYASNFVAILRIIY